jgi:hypothetical protein
MVTNAMPLSSKSCAALIASLRVSLMTFRIPSGPRGFPWTINTGFPNRKVSYRRRKYLAVPKTGIDRPMNSLLGQNVPAGRDDNGAPRSIRRAHSLANLLEPMMGPAGSRWPLREGRELATCSRNVGCVPLIPRLPQGTHLAAPVLPRWGCFSERAATRRLLNEKAPAISTDSWGRQPRVFLPAGFLRGTKTEAGNRLRS